MISLTTETTNYFTVPTHCCENTLNLWILLKHDLRIATSGVGISESEVITSLAKKYVFRREINFLCCL